MIEIQKNAMEKIRFQLDEYRGYKLVDIRVWIQGEDKLIVTKKGISFSPSIWHDFRQAIDKLEAELIEAGLIEKAEPELTQV